MCERIRTRFVVDGTLWIFEVHDMPFVNAVFDKLAREMEASPESKESLQYYFDDVDMEWWDRKKLRELRDEQKNVTRRIHFFGGI